MVGIGPITVETDGILVEISVILTPVVRVKDLENSISRSTGTTFVVTNISETYY